MRRTKKLAYWSLIFIHNFVVSEFLSSFLVETGVSFDLSDKELFCIEEQDVFDRVYSLVRGYNVLPASCKVYLVESLRSNLSVLLPNVDSLSRASQGQDDVTPMFDRVASHRNAFKIYTFFLLTVVLTEEFNVTSNNNVKVFSFSHHPSFFPVYVLTFFLIIYFFLSLLQMFSCVQWRHCYFLTLPLENVY